MKKILLGLALLLMTPLSICAQSSMTDSQVADYVQREAARGTSQAQIVTHLMQSGVDISQIRRVRRMYERQAKGTGLGNATETATANSRLRNSNGNKRTTRAQAEQYDKQRNATTSGRIQGNTQWQGFLRRERPGLPPDAARGQRHHAHRHCYPAQAITLPTAQGQA